MEPKVKNSKALRKQIYQLALDKIKFWNGVYPWGFCMAIRGVLYDVKIDHRLHGNGKFLLETFKRSVYKELMAYCPVEKTPRGFWFPICDEGTKKRIAILEEIISTM